MTGKTLRTASVDLSFYKWKKMTVCVTSCCNRTCLMCPSALDDHHTLSRSIMLDLILFASKNNFEELEFSGGEPLLLGGMADLIEKACELIPRVQLTTNGILLDDGLIRRLSGIPNLFLFLPVEGVGDPHDEIRQDKGGFKRLELLLNRLFDAGIALAINTVVQHKNHDVLFALYERFASTPILFHSFPLIEHFLGNEKERLHAGHWKVLERNLKKIEHAATKSGRAVSVTPTSRMWFEERLFDPDTMMFPGKNCPIPRSNLVVTPTGFVFPCWQHGWVWNEPLRGLRLRSIDEIVLDPVVIDEIIRATDGGCSGCSTYCYNWHPEVQDKIYGFHLEQFRENLLKRGGECS